jgi:hypothetical protein
LLFGNAALGLAETWLLKKLFKVDIASGWLIAANYISMICGSFLVMYSGYFTRIAVSDPFAYGLTVLCGTWLLAFVATVLFEWPFYSVANGRFGFKRVGLKRSIATNAISYGCLTLFFAFVGKFSALTSIRQTSLQSLQPLAGWVYFITPDGQDVHRIRTDGSKVEVVFTNLGARTGNQGWSRLTIERRGRDKLGSLYLRQSKERLIKRDVASMGTFAISRSVKDDGSYSMGNLTFGPGSVLFWHPRSVYVGYWAYEGLTVGEKQYAFETPLLTIKWRSVTDLPNGMIVANFGEQIVVFDPKTNRVANLVRGDGPAVLLDVPSPITPSKN